MITRRHQSGMSILGILCVLLMLGFFAMNIIRMAPPYFEYISVKKIIAEIATEPEVANESFSDIRRKIETIFNTNQIYKLDPKAVKIYSKQGKTYIDASYEVRLPVMWRIDSVLKFDDLLFEAGNPDPLPAPIPKK